MIETTLRATPYRRVVTLDIETVSLDPFLIKGALDPLTGRVACIGLLIDDGERLSELSIASEDEIKILTEFWDTVDPADLLVGFNLIEFDLPFVQKRSWVGNVRPTRSLDLRRFYSTHIDVMQLWNNWSFRKVVSLDALSGVLNCGQKSAHGEDVAAMWAAGDLDSIRAYCLEDVRITYRVYCRLTYQLPRSSKGQPKANAAERPFDEKVTAGSNGERPRRDLGLFPNQTVIQHPHDSRRGALALTTRGRKR